MNEINLKLEIDEPEEALAILNLFTKMFDGVLEDKNTKKAAILEARRNKKPRVVKPKIGVVEED